MSLVLSIFSGLDVLGYGFELEGFAVVGGIDLLWGRDIRTFHPPSGRFNGIIGGDPCQSHSSLANLVRAKGLEPSFPDMTPEFQRMVEEAQPAWFLRENVPRAPDIKPAGYDVRNFMLDNSTLDSGDGWGHEQMRKRRFWFGTRDIECPELRAHIDFAQFVLPDAVQAVAGDARSVPVAMGGSGKVKVTAVGGNDGTADAINGYRKARKKAVVRDEYRCWPGGTKQAPVTGRNEGRVGGPGIDYSPPRRDLAEMLRLQGLPKNWLDWQPWTMQAKRKMVGNAVSLPMARALALAVKSAMEAT